MLSPAPTRRRLPRLLAYVVLLGLFVSAITETFRNHSWQGDSRLRHYVIDCWRAGGDPYRPADISATAQYSLDTAYIYPPDTLPFFALLHVRGVDTERVLYTFIQLAVAGALLFLWQRYFLAPGEALSPWFLGFCLCGLGGTVLTDIRVGNISLLEQLFLAGGLAAWLRGRYALFAGLLWVAAACKFTLLAFSVLLLLPPARQWLMFALVWVTMGLRLTLDYALSPRLTLDFVHALTGGFGGVNENGNNNPCLLEFLKDLVSFTNDTLSGQDLIRAALPAYALLVLVILGLSWLAWGAIRRRFPAGDPSGLRLIYLTALAYALTAPRMKDYSYIVLLVPVWCVFRWTLAGRPQVWLALIFLACLSDRAEFFGLRLVEAFLWRYSPLFIGLTAWVCLLLEAFGKMPGPAAATGEGAPPDTALA